MFQEQRLKEKTKKKKQELVLSDTDPEDYKEYPKLSMMTPMEREKRIK